MRWDSDYDPWVWFEQETPPSRVRAFLQPSNKAQLINIRTNSYLIESPFSLDRNYLSFEYLSFSSQLKKRMCAPLKAIQQSAVTARLAKCATLWGFHRNHISQKHTTHMLFAHGTCVFICGKPTANTHIILHCVFLSWLLLVVVACFVIRTRVDGRFDVARTNLPSHRSIRAQHNLLQTRQKGVFCSWLSAHSELSSIYQLFVYQCRTQSIVGYFVVATLNQWTAKGSSFSHPSVQRRAASPENHSRNTQKLYRTWGEIRNR